MRPEKIDANWWLFALDDGERGSRIWTDEAAGTVEVNPEVDGHHLLSYHGYLGLDRLLACQTPCSLVPDERIFIITHQLFELVFKQMIFDLGVIATTFHGLLGLDEAAFQTRARGAGRGEPETGARQFFRPALTAAARLRQASRGVMPAIMSFLAREETFSGDEFERRFRGHLMPASALQSAQFRLIQRALGKSGLLAVRIFPADAYRRAYEGRSEAEIDGLALAEEAAGLVRVTDRLILRESHAIATPEPGSVLIRVAECDDLGQQVLARLAATARSEQLPDGGGETVALLPGDPDSVARLADRFREMLVEALRRMNKTGNPDLIDKRVRVFKDDWQRTVAGENRRRLALAEAAAGARLLFGQAEGTTYLAAILANLVEADRAIAGHFLAFHRQVVEGRIGAVPGTAGGGVLFLDFSRELLKYFPALAVARSGIAGS